jgi:hypothetical protein
MSASGDAPDKHGRNPMSSAKHLKHETQCAHRPREIAASQLMSEGRGDPPRRGVALYHPIRASVRRIRSGAAPI